MLAASLAALAGCYAPAVRDCTVSCASPNDCVSGQICGADGFCAAPQIAGQCGAALSDAGPPLDAAGSDGSALVSLHVHITGKGSVIVEGRGICSSRNPQRGDCTYDIARNASQSVYAVAIQPDQAFTGWISTACNGQDASCMFTPVEATGIAARFEHK